MRMYESMDAGKLRNLLIRYYRVDKKLNSIAATRLVDGLLSIGDTMATSPAMFVKTKRLINTALKTQLFGKEEDKVVTDSLDDVLRQSGFKKMTKEDYYGFAGAGKDAQIKYLKSGPVLIYDSADSDGGEGLFIQLDSNGRYALSFPASSDLTKKIPSIIEYISLRKGRPSGAIRIGLENQFSDLKPIIF